MSRVGPEKPEDGPKPSSRGALHPSSSPIERGRTPFGGGSQEGSKTGRKFLELFRRNQEEKRKEDIEVHEKLEELIKDRYGGVKLNVRRAEIFIRVTKSYLRQMQLYLELLIYIAFTAIFFFLVVNVIPIQYAPAQVGSFLDSGAFLNFVARGADNSAFASINTYGDFFAYLQGTVVPLIDPANNTDVALFFTRLGALRLRQVRGAPRECTWPKEAGVRCSGQFKDVGDSRDPFGNGDAPWLWSAGMSELRPSAAFLRDGGYSWSYGTGGYVVDIPIASENASAALQALVDNGWYDELTRAMTATFNLYNRHTGTYVVVELLTEMQAMGQALNSARANSVQIDASSKPATILGVGIFFIIFLGMYLFMEARQMWREGLIPYITDWFNLFDVTNLGLIIALFFKYGEFLTWSQDMHKQIRPSEGELDPNLFYDLSTAVDYTIRMQEIAGIAILFSCIRIFKFFELQPRLNILTNTVGQAIPDLAAFLVIFVIIFAGYAFFGWVTFGYKVDSFTTFYGSFATLFGNLGGGLDIAALLDASPAAGVFFYFSFVIIVSLILINIFIAIVGKFYTEAGEEAVSREAEFRSELEPEDRMTILQKLFALRARVSRLHRYVNEAAEPTGKKGPPQLVDHAVAVGDVIELLLTVDVTSRPPENDTVAKAADMAVDKAMGLRAMPSPSPHEREAPPEPKLTCHIDAKKAYVFFLLEILEQGDRIVLKPPQPTRRPAPGHPKPEPRLDLHLEILTDPEFSSQGGTVSLRCQVQQRSTPGAKQADRIYTGSKLRVAWLTSMKMIGSSVITPQKQISDRTKTLFQQFSIEKPRRVLEDVVLERELVRISGRNSELKDKGGAGVSGLVPARRTFVLDEMLGVIHQLEVLTKEDGVFGENEKRNIAYLVHEASNIDALHKMIVQYGKTSTLEEYLAWRARALRMMPAQPPERPTTAGSVLSGSAPGAPPAPSADGAGVLATPAKAPPALPPMSPSVVQPGLLPSPHAAGHAGLPHALVQATPAARAGALAPLVMPGSSAAPPPVAMSASIELPPPSPGPEPERPGTPKTHVQMAHQEILSAAGAPPPTAPRTAKVPDPYLELIEVKEAKDNVEIIQRMYFRLMQLADEFDGRVEELFLLAATSAAGGVHPEIIRDSLRFDEMEEIVRAALTLAGGGRTGGISELKIKMETVRFLSTFPLSCFDKLIPEREKARPFVPKPYDTKRIADTPEDPAERLDKAVAQEVAALCHEAWAIEKLRKPEMYYYWDGKGQQPPNGDKSLKPFADLSQGGKDWNVDTLKQVIRGIDIFGYELEEGVEHEKALAVLREVARPFAGDEELVDEDGEPIEGRLTASDLAARLKPGFRPRLIDHSNMLQEHRSLAQLLAKNTFNEWAHALKNDGWTYAETTNKAKKVDRRLVPYELLDESDQIDNLIAPRTVIAAVSACGYRIVPKKVRHTALQLAREHLSRHLFGRADM